MANVVYKGGALRGSVTLPPSKSVAHRAALCAALSGESSTIKNIDMSDDITVTARAVKALGCDLRYDENSCELHVSGGCGADGEIRIDCGESGSSLRFLIPVAAALGKKVSFTGAERLGQRPLGVYKELLPAHGVTWTECEGGFPISVEGKLLPGSFPLPGNVSSQFITGLMMALPLLEEDSRILLTSPLESEGYVELTVSVLSHFGIEIIKTESGWKVPGNQKYRAMDYTVEGDWSQAAFYLCMAALSPSGEPVYLEGLDMDSVQGDMMCVSVFESFGLKTEIKDGVLKCWNPESKKEFGGLHGTEIDASQIPDMVPAIAACAACAKGRTVIYNAQRLRIKESDRLSAMEDAITALGGTVKATEDGLVIDGVPALTGGTVLGRNDHRIVMSMAACSLRSKGDIQVTDAHSIRKSYPGFYKDFRSLGGVMDVINVG